MTALHRLAQEVRHPAPARSEVPLWRMLAALMLAPASFSLQIVVSYVVAADLCPAGVDPRGWLLMVNGLAVVGVLGGWGLAYWNWKRTRGEKEGGAARMAEEGEGRTRFLALCALWASTLFLLSLVVELTAILMLGPCAGLFAPG